jgi:hypothetical protein
MISYMSFNAGPLEFEYGMLGVNCILLLYCYLNLDLYARLAESQVLPTAFPIEVRFLAWRSEDEMTLHVLTLIFLPGRAWVLDV